MLVDLVLLVRKDELEKAGFTESMAYWGDEVYSREPPKFTYHSSLFFLGFDIELGFYRRSFERCMKCSADFSEYASLFFDPLEYEMSDLRFAILKKKSDLPDNIMIRFFRDISKLDAFIIFMHKEEEPIEKSFMVKTQEELMDAICNGFDWEEGDGVLIVKQLE